MGRKKTINEMRIAMLMDEDLSIDNIIARLSVSLMIKTINFCFPP